MRSKSSSDGSPHSCPKAKTEYKRVNGEREVLQQVKIFIFLDFRVISRTWTFFRLVGTCESVETVETVRKYTVLTRVPVTSLKSC
jgi:hypothetical protein